MEQVFAPKLRNKPLVILSNNEGCIIARSKEAKAVGIPMGAPLFKYRDLIIKHDVTTLASNFPLYGDMSRRVMKILEDFELDLEIYSVDEAFLFIEQELDFLKLAAEIQKRILQWTGIPVSIGIAPTKTLAKVATTYAKSNGSGIVLLKDSQMIESYLKKLDVGEVWGIGHRLKEKLNSFRVKTAYELTQKNDSWIRNQMSVVGLRTVYELRGTSCLKLNEIASQKSILRSRSFTVEIGQLETLEQKIASFADTLGRQLRKYGLVCSQICTFASSNRHHTHVKYVSDSFHIQLTEPSSYTPLLISKAKKSLRKIFQKGVLYKRAGVLVYGLTNEDSKQRDLFSRPDIDEFERKRLMETYDRINHHYGEKSLYFAAEGFIKKNIDKSTSRSGCYTTSWDELLTISLSK